MRHLVSVALLMVVLSIMSICLGGFTWWAISASESPLTTRNRQSSSVVAIVDTATELEQLRRTCRPIAALHDQMGITLEALVKKSNETLWSLVSTAIGGGIFLFFVFGYFYVTVKRLRSKHPEVFE